MKRRYLELRPALARVYVAVTSWPDAAPVLRPLGFGWIGPEVRVGALAQQPCALDFGAGSVDGWLQRLMPESPVRARQRKQLQVIGAMPLSLSLPTWGTTLQQLRQMRAAR